MSSANNGRTSRIRHENQNRGKYGEKKNGSTDKISKQNLSQLANENGQTAKSGQSGECVPCEPCVPCPDKESDSGGDDKVFKTVGLDPRFQQQNQTARCFVMYCDFYHCEQILGEGHDACSWFKKAFTTLCPPDWVEKWDELREKNLMPWYKPTEFAQGPYPR